MKTNREIKYFEFNNKIIVTSLLSLRCNMIKIPFCSKDIGVKHRSKFYSSSAVMVTSSYECNIFDMVFSNIQQTNTTDTSIYHLH